jgi:transcriptional regulator with XRE-family HTH domain
MRYAYEKLVRKLMIVGKSQGWVADQIRRKFGKDEKVSQATVSHVLTGKNQFPETVKKVADVLDVPMEDLVAESPVKAPKSKRKAS